LGYNISYEGEKDLNIKATNFVKVLGITNHIFKPSPVSRHTRIRICKTLARPAVFYGSEAWTIRRTEDRRLISAEMCFLRRTAGYTRWDHKRNEDILTELQMSQITEYIYQYRKNWKEYADRIPKKYSKIPTKKEKKFRKTFEKMEGFSFVTLVTGRI
jgi:hypothetical protein